MDYEYRASVEGFANAGRLINELSRSYIFNSAMPLANEHQTSFRSFQVPHNSLLPFAVVRGILSAMPRVHLTIHTALA
jgi:hypothetical protein